MKIRRCSVLYNSLDATKFKDKGVRRKEEIFYFTEFRPFHGLLFSFDQ